VAFCAPLFDFIGHEPGPFGQHDIAELVSVAVLL